LGLIEHFYPKREYPEQALDEENLLLVCNTCNILKSNKFPIDDGGYPLLLNPKTDKWDENIEITPEGIAIGKTEKGKTTIELLKLNRESLIDKRKIVFLANKLDDNFNKINKDYFENFEKNIDVIRQLNLISTMIREDLQYPQFRMLYSNAISALETYLSDALTIKIITSKNHLRSFVETYKDFNESKFSISEIFKMHEKIEDRVNDALRGIMYHNLPKLKGIYKDSLGVSFPDISFLTKAIIKRHDFVHRSGKTVTGEMQTLSQKDINELVEKIVEFVTEVNTQIKKI
jgi:hypothetical protein